MNKLIKNKFFMLITYIALTSTITFCSEAQNLGYWQRFKNWISEIAELPSLIRLKLKIENEIKHLPTIQSKIDALRMMEVSCSPQGGKPDRTTCKAIDQLIKQYLLQKAKILSGDLDEFIKKTEKLIQQTKLRNIIQETIKEFPTLQSKIDALKAMQNAYAPTGEKPNKIALQAVNIVLEELEKEK